MNKNIKRKKFNISLLGESEVGKTRIINYYLGKEIDEINLSTIGIESYMEEAEFDGEVYKFKIYDTAGQERYRSISKSTIKISDGFLLVFSVINRESFNRLDYWLNSIKDIIDIKKKVIILVGNKIDFENRDISNEEAVIYAKMKDVVYIETSAKTGFGIKELFQKLYQDVYTLYKNNKNKNDDSNDNIEISNNIKNDKKKRRC